MPIMQIIIPVIIPIFSFSLRNIVDNIATIISGSTYVNKTTKDVYFELLNAL